ANSVVALRSRQVEIVAHADVQCQLVCHAPVVLDETAKVPILRSSGIVNVVVSPVAWSAGSDHQARHGIAPSPPWILRRGVVIERVRAGGNSREEYGGAV